LLHFFFCFLSGLFLGVCFLLEQLLEVQREAVLLDPLEPPLRGGKLVPWYLEDVNEGFLLLLAHLGLL